MRSRRGRRTEFRGRGVAQYSFRPSSSRAGRWFRRSQQESEETPQSLDRSGDNQDNSRNVGQTAYGFYVQNPTFIYQTIYGHYLVPYGPYFPVLTPLPIIITDGYPYYTQQFQFPGAYYEQQSPPNMLPMSSPPRIPQVDPEILIDGALSSDNSTQLSPPRSDWLISTEGTEILTPILSPAVSPQPTVNLARLCQCTMHQPSEWLQRAGYGFGPYLSYVSSQTQNVVYLDSTPVAVVPMFESEDRGSYSPRQGTSGSSNQMDEHRSSLDNESSILDNLQQPQSFNSAVAVPGAFTEDLSVSTSEDSELLDQITADFADTVLLE